MQYKILISKIKKDQNEYVFIRNLSFMQCLVERLKSTNWKNNNGKVNSSLTAPIGTESNLKK